ncbi:MULTISPECIES: helix-turn-helix domain-containing protein [unclassified Streptomyces]|uniref:helix-turn-helix domain-containing protein n=1 Tax=unclassified Streptomyces TaxID=2593676 RepID=UPI00081B1C8C|nr:MULTISPECIES: helix-turn-helix transcriptional regulator [unclassified Streptomyces]MYQ55478.1 helix-turn-helix domain-containing protein [Streptomyces sp. SID4941]SCE38556.1 Helix-turn-helix domain-containing protein [Streptomyces sp. PalvLS-984]SDE16158.1 Helix-turn-helix domain-containing protein [Streptomyces sp. AmelKG-A3]
MGTEIQDFAAELSGLKERSGLSYGMLARKLHMSTSTVHRYCNGDAVPHDYAPVERFARVCGASGDELVALHRKWILADEAKRRGARKPEPGGAAGSGGAAAAGPAAGSAAEPEAGTGSASAAEAGAGSASAADPAPAPVAEPEAGSGAGADSGPALDPDARPDPDAVPAAGDAAAGAVRPESRVVTAAPPGPRRRWSGRTRVLLAAAAVVALTVPAVVVVHGLTQEDQAEEVRPRTTVAATLVAPDTSTGPSAGVSPSPDRTSGSPVPADSESAGPSPSPGGTAGQGGGGGAENGGVPVHATISSYNWEAPCGQYYLLDQEPDRVPPPPVPQDTRGWARSLHGVDGGAMKLELTVQGASQEAVVLRGLHVRVQSRGPALAWSAYSMGNGCGSGIVPQSFDIDLDDSRPRSTPVAGQDGDTVVPAKDFPYQVSSTDVEVFHLDAHVEGHDVTWYLELEWTSGGRSGVLRIDDRGEPFRTSGIAARPEYLYRPDIAQWVNPES